MPEASGGRGVAPGSAVLRAVAFALALVAALALGVAACGGAGPAISVADAWVRVPAGTGSLTAAYFTVTNNGSTPDTLLGVSSPDAMAMVHRSTTNPDGMTAMLPVPRLEVPAGATVRFEPGGLHVMLEGLPPDTAPGATVELVLEFEHAGRITVQATVRSG